MVRFITLNVEPLVVKVYASPEKDANKKGQKRKRTDNLIPPSFLFEFDGKRGECEVDYPVYE